MTVPHTAPAAIRELPAWLIWRFEHEPGLAKPRKVPYYAAGGKRHGKQGGAQDLPQLTTFEVARQAAQRRGYDGVGFATLEQFGICALDFDNCVAEGVVHPEVEALVGDTYAEYSPSGNGIRMFVQGDLGDRKDVRGAGFGVETFSRKGFVTYTGNPLELTKLLGNDDVVGPIDEPIRALVAKRFAKEPSSAGPIPASLGVDDSHILRILANLPNDLHYEDWVNVGMAIHHETGGEGFELWDSWSQGSPKYGSREYNEDRWRSFGKRTDRPFTLRGVMHLAGINPNGPASADEFEIIADAPADPKVKPNRFPVLSADEFANRPAPAWLIKHVLPKAELVVLYGASGSGKTFMALDMAGSIARGIDWRGKKTKAGRVVYIAAEGAGGFRNRIQAYATQHNVDLADLNIGVINAAPNFMQRTDALEVMSAIKSAGGADVIVIDTFAQVMPGGNENAGEDMGTVLAHCKGLHKGTGAVVILVHHSGKDSSKGARGWSGLRAAADAELEVVRAPGGRLLRLSKQKDGEDELQWGFDLDIVEIGVDEDLEPITSCIVVEAAIPSLTAAPLRKMGPVEVVVNQVVQEMAIAQTSGLEVKEILKEAAARLPAPEKGKRDTRLQVARRALESLCKGDPAPYFQEDDCISII